MEKNDILDQIKRILALANGAATEGEAQAAFAKAKRLMDLHNIEMVDVETQKTESIYLVDTATIRADFDKSEAKFVAMIIEELCKVKSVVMHNPGIGIRLGFFGEKSNVEIGIYTFSVLSRQFRQYWSLYKINNKPGANAMISYYIGLSEGYISQLKQQQSTDANECTALAIVDNELQELFEKTFKVKHMCMIFNENDKAYAAGVIDSKNLEINKGLQGSSSKKGLIE